MSTPSRKPACPHGEGVLEAVAKSLHLVFERLEVVVNLLWVLMVKS